jgi:UDP-3-O-[3-hydroxymyristoyl] glucosamine N-acyltransferase
LGAEGFETRILDGRPIVVPHLGGVKIGRRVEIQSNCVISRALYGGHTEIGDDTKLDAQVHIAHQVTIGQRSRLASGVLVAGSTSVGNDVWIGPRVTVSNGLQIGDGAVVPLGEIVTRDIPPETGVLGGKQMPKPKLQSFLRNVA